MFPHFLKYINSFTQGYHCREQTSFNVTVQSLFFNFLSFLLGSPDLLPKFPSLISDSF